MIRRFSEKYTFKRTHTLMPGADLLEYVCNEFNVDKDQLVASSYCKTLNCGGVSGLVRFLLQASPIATEALKILPTGTKPQSL
jgi:hypothetical protein